MKLGARVVVKSKVKGMEELYGRKGTYTGMVPARLPLLRVELDSGESALFQAGDLRDVTPVPKKDEDLPIGAQRGKRRVPRKITPRNYRGF